MILRVVLFLAGIVICAAKGLLLPALLVIPGEQNKEDMFDNGFGLLDPCLASEWARIRARKEPLTHTLTNIVVEWARLHPQRAVKFFSALSVLALLCGILGGTLL